MPDIRPIKGFWLLPTYSCNNACGWCYAKSRRRADANAPLPVLKNFIDVLALQGAKSCVLIGGEPTCYPDIVELVAYAKARGLTPRMMSNGRRLANKDFVHSLKKAGLATCSISIEGTESVHDEAVGARGAFAESFQGIANCIGAGIRTNTITTIHKKNCMDLEAVIQCVRQLDVRRMVFNMCSPQVGDQDMVIEGVVGLAQYATLATSLAEKHEFVCFYGLVPLCCYDIDRVLPLIRSGRINFACSIWSDSVSIDPDGNVLVCNHMPHINIGNLHVDDMVAIVGAKARLREKFRKEAPSKKCVRCPCWNTCKGGCSMLWMRLNAEKVIPGLPGNIQKGGEENGETNQRAEARVSCG